ncbi:hypothetical protein BH09BAC6_BH09BAC6_09310 [soil metagenome]
MNFSFPQPNNILYYWENFLKMKKHLFALLIILSVIACKKSPVANPLNAGAKLLLAIEKDVNPAGTDTVLVKKYSYDSNNRLIQEVQSVPGTQFPYTTKYDYDSEGNLKAAYLYNATSPSLVYTNANGKPVASFLNVQTIDTAGTYTITNNKVTAAKYGSGYRYAIGYAGDNYTVITFTQNSYVITRTFTYGNKKSPFYIGGFKWFEGDAPPYSQLQGQNEVIKRVDENTGSATGTFTF